MPQWSFSVEIENHIYPGYNTTKKLTSIDLVFGAISHSIFAEEPNMPRFDGMKSLALSTPLPIIRPRDVISLITEVRYRLPWPLTTKRPPVSRLAAANSRRQCRGGRLDRRTGSGAGR